MAFNRLADRHFDAANPRTAMRHLPSGKLSAASVIVFAGALWLVRSQATVYDVSYMRAMIPPHSIAIMTGERAHIQLGCAS